MNTITIKRDVRYAAAAASLVAFWVVAAVGVITADQVLQPLSAGACLAAKLGVIGLIAGMYMRFSARDATIERALFTGIAWATFSIAAELIIISRYDRSWYPFFGPPSNAAFRNVLLIAWIGSMTLFARERRLS